MQTDTNTQKDWELPGWPWELELFALIFVILAVVVPLQLHSRSESSIKTSLLIDSSADNPAKAALAEQRGVLWSVGIVGLYLLHLVFARGSLDLLSTPVTHLFAPLLFAMAAYYRIFGFGAPLQIAVLALAVIVITLVLARLQMARYMMNFRNVKWDLSSPTRFDRSYARLITEVKPLVYVPRYYRACELGILVEGWFYVMAIPFKLVQSIGAVAQASMTAAGEYFATSTKSLIRLELTESTIPLFLSPANRDEFLKYCAHHVVRLKRSTATGTHGGVAASPYSRTERISLSQTQRLAAAQPAAHQPTAAPDKT